MNESKFEKKLKPMLKYVGTIGASIMVVAYIITVFIMVFGFEIHSLKQSMIFALVNAVVGLIIMQFLKIQGIDFAKNLESNKDTLTKWAENQPKKKKSHSIKYFWVTSIIKDVIIKALTVALTTVCLIYIVIQGSRDYILLLLAVVNLLMFVCFGLLSLVNAYDFFNEKHIPFIKEKLNEIETQRSKEAEKTTDKKKRPSRKENTKSVAMAEKEPNKQRDDSVHISGGSDILDSSMDTSTISSDNTEPVVLDNCNNNDSFLGRTIYPSSPASNSNDFRIKEDLQKNKIQKEGE